MDKLFVFIIPLTPDEHLTMTRKKLRHLCLSTLQKQSYLNWRALLIGNSNVEIKDERFIFLQKEGIKQEKLQYATNFIRHELNSAHYLIRLDDDDIFNPQILQEISLIEFDIFVDKFHYFLDFETGCVSKQIRYWFPNTFVQRIDHALTQFGTLSKKDIPVLNEYISLIENDHSKIHRFYKGKRVMFSPAKNPLYLRVLNRDSITSKTDISYEAYLDSFGLWNSPLPLVYRDILSKENVFGCKSRRPVSIFNYLRHQLTELKALLNYQREVLG